MSEKNAPLRAVEPGETVLEKPKPLTLVEAVEAGEYIEILRAQRRDIAESLPDEKGPAKAALHRQLSIIAKEIELLESRPDEVRGGVGAEVSDSDFNSAAV